MHGFRAGSLARDHDRLDREIGLRCRRWTDANRFIGHGHEWHRLVCLRINRDAGNPHPLRRFDDAASDFAAIGDEDLFEHGRWKL